jgi:hypothetical protein
MMGNSTMRKQSFASAVACVAIGFAVPAALVAAFLGLAFMANPPEWIGPGLHLLGLLVIALGGSFASGCLCGRYVSGLRTVPHGLLANSAVWLSLAWFGFFACTGGKVFSEDGLACLVIAIVLSTLGFLTTLGGISVARRLSTLPHGGKET